MNAPFDAVVAGAGSAGSAAALHLARLGLRVALLDARPRSEAGASWVNGVPQWMFDRAGLTQPQAPERRGGDGDFHMLGATPAQRIVLRKPPMHGVDMGALVSRLHGLAEDAGVQMGFDLRVAELECDASGRPTSLRTSDGTSWRARLFVDATGMKGVLRRRAPELSALCPPPSRDHICSAAQQVRRIANPDGARAHLEHYHLRPHDVLAFMGRHGGFSTANIVVDLDAGEVELLTGAIAQPAFASGPEILRGLVEAHRWIGEPVFGGSGAIPLRRPYDRIAAPGIALIGDAACQVFPAHGSGVGAGLVAAKLLAEAVTGEPDPGALRSVWRYQAAAQRELGAKLAAYDLFRRMSQALDGAALHRLIEAGLMRPETLRCGLEQKLPPPDPRIAANGLRDILGARRSEPALVRHVATTIARMPAVAALYAAYPGSPSRRRLRRWSRAVAALFGDRPDLA